MQDEKKPKQSLVTRGIVCSRCGGTHHFVVYTRQHYGERILRRRECRNCGRRMTTMERVKD